MGEGDDDVRRAHLHQAWSTGGQEYIEGGPTRRADKQGSRDWPVRERLVSASTCFALSPYQHGDPTAPLPLSDYYQQAMNQYSLVSGILLAYVLAGITLPVMTAPIKFRCQAGIATGCVAC